MFMTFLQAACEKQCHDTQLTLKIFYFTFAGIFFNVIIFIYNSFSFYIYPVIENYFFKLIVSVQVFFCLIQNSSFFLKILIDTNFSFHYLILVLVLVLVESTSYHTASQLQSPNLAVMLFHSFPFSLYIVSVCVCLIMYLEIILYKRSFSCVLFWKFIIIGFT